MSSGADRGAKWAVWDGRERARRNGDVLFGVLAVVIVATPVIGWTLGATSLQPPTLLPSIEASVAIAWAAIALLVAATLVRALLGHLPPVAAPLAIAAVVLTGAWLVAAAVETVAAGEVAWSLIAPWALLWAALLAAGLARARRAHTVGQSAAGVRS